MLKFAVAGACCARSRRTMCRRSAAPRDEDCVDCPASKTTTAKRSSRKSATSIVRFRTKLRSTLRGRPPRLRTQAPYRNQAQPRVDPQRHAAPRRMRRLRAAAEVRQPGGRQEGPQRRSFARHQHPDRGAGRHPRQGNQSPRHPQERDPPRRRGPAQPHHRRKRNPLRPARPGADPRRIHHRTNIKRWSGRTPSPFRCTRAISASAAIAAACSVPTARCPALRVRG